MKLLIATGNQHKFREITAMMAEMRLSFVSLRQLEGAPVVIEDGDTFEANAIKKAVTLARYSGMWTLADDSGLEVDALGGAPGVYSARYAGEPTDDQANNQKLLQVMTGVMDRRARFRCVIALADSLGRVRVVSGSCEGQLLAAVQGKGGFGYDPLFVPSGYAQTFAELPADIKNQISHRASALKAAILAWQDCLMHDPPAWPT